MIIRVYLNNMNFRYDVYHILNIFYNLYDIEFTEEKECDLHIKITDNNTLSIGKYNEDEIIYSLDNKFKLKEEIRRALFLYLTNITGKKMPWGTLIGIRPCKIALEKIREGMSEENIINYYNEHYITSRSKSELCIDIAKKEINFINENSDSISIYVDMPFCPTRCLYCSFTSNPIKACKDIIEPYINKLCYEMSEISSYIEKKKLKIECVYFGGGTPSSVNNEQFEKVLNSIYNNFIKSKNVKEFTVECGRPDSITENKLISMKKYGVSRISINPQTMNDETLRLIGRNHKSSDVVDKFILARKLGFDNINMDIIVGLPLEGINEIKKTCMEVLKLKPDSLTVHGLSIKRGSKLHEEILKSGCYEKVSQDELILMFEETLKASVKLGMKPYYMYRQKNIIGNMENIGYSLPKKEGLYNIEMIEERQTIIGIGADGVTKVFFKDENRIERFPNVKDVREYIIRIDEMINKKIELLNSLYNI